MTDLNITAASSTALEYSREGTALLSKAALPAVSKVSQWGAEPLQSANKSEKRTDFNYSIDHKDNALHLRVKNSDGELVREIVFERLDPNLLNTYKLKGVLVDADG